MNEKRRILWEAVWNDPKKRRIIRICVILALIVIILLLKSCQGCQGSSTAPKGPEAPIGEWDSALLPVEEEEKADRNITFAGYISFTVTEKAPQIDLYNPEINFVDMQFTLRDHETGEIITRTDLIPAGKHAYINVVKYYQKTGTYLVDIATATFDHETGEPYNGMNQQMEIIFQ